MSRYEIYWDNDDKRWNVWVAQSFGPFRQLRCLYSDADYATALAVLRDLRRYER